MFPVFDLLGSFIFDPLGELGEYGVFPVFDKFGALNIFDPFGEFEEYGVFPVFSLFDIFGAFNTLGPLGVLFSFSADSSSLPYKALILSLYLSAIYSLLNIFLITLIKYCLVCSFKIVKDHELFIPIMTKAAYFLFSYRDKSKRTSLKKIS